MPGLGVKSRLLLALALQLGDSAADAAPQEDVPKTARHCPFLAAET